MNHRMQEFTLKVILFCVCLIQPDTLTVSIRFPGKFTRRGSTDTAADADSLSAKHSHSHHSLLRDMPDHSNSHSDNTVKEGEKKDVAESI